MLVDLLKVGDVRALTCDLGTRGVWRSYETFRSTARAIPRRVASSAVLGKYTWADGRTKVTFRLFMNKRTLRRLRAASTDLHICPGLAVHLLSTARNEQKGERRE